MRDGYSDMEHNYQTISIGFVYILVRWKPSRTYTAPKNHPLPRTSSTCVLAKSPKAANPSIPSLIAFFTSYACAPRVPALNPYNSRSGRRLYRRGGRWIPPFVVVDDGDDDGFAGDEADVVERSSMDPKVKVFNGQGR